MSAGLGGRRGIVQSRDTGRSRGNGQPACAISRRKRTKYRGGHPNGPTPHDSPSRRRRSGALVRVVGGRRDLLRPWAGRGDGDGRASAGQGRTARIAVLPQLACAHGRPDGPRASNRSAVLTKGAPTRRRSLGGGLRPRRACRVDMARACPCARCRGGGGEAATGEASNAPPGAPVGSPRVERRPAPSHTLPVRIPAASRRRPGGALRRTGAETVVDIWATAT